MKVHGINNLTKKDIPLYYRNDYEGVGDVELPPGGRRLIPIEFTVEMKPTGDKVIDVKLKEQIDYPLLPLVRALKETIKNMESNGELR